MAHTNSYHYNIGVHSHNFDLIVAINRCIISVNKPSAICFFLATHLQATRVDIFIGHDMFIFCSNQKSDAFEQLFLVFSNPHKIFEISYRRIVSYRYSDTFFSASSCCTLRSDVAIHIEHKINTRSVFQCIRYILLYFSFIIFSKILRGTWLMDIHESCTINNRTFGSWICSTWLVNFLYAT